jgi:hypothetical protein
MNANTTIRYAHYTYFGASTPPACADADGYVAYRDGYERLPYEVLTASELWIDRMRAYLACVNDGMCI